MPAVLQASPLLTRIPVREAQRKYPPDKFTYTYDEVIVDKHKTYFVNFKATPLEEQEETSPIPDNFLKTKEEKYDWGTYFEGFIVSQNKKGEQTAVKKKYILLTDTNTLIEVVS